jgi:hypothetical protein
MCLFLKHRISNHQFFGCNQKLFAPSATHSMNRRIRRYGVGVVMPNLHRAVFLFLAAFLFAQAAPATSAPVTRNTINQVSELILKSYDFLNKKDYDAAREECEKAQALEEKFDADPFISATVNVCFGDVEDYEENTEEACKHYDQALEEFKKTPARHPAQRVLRNQIRAVEGKRAYLSCGA